MTGQLPQFSYAATSHQIVIPESNESGSTVFVMIETQEALGNLDAIASVEGADVLLVGCNDMSIELGIPGEFEAPALRAALEKVSAACKKHDKIFAMAGLYDRPDMLRWAVNELGVDWILGGQDSTFVAKGAKVSADALLKAERNET
jgi:2-keto-3-deoxy-L-rhamnonate aldolase RhmA